MYRFWFAPAVAGAILFASIGRAQDPPEQIAAPKTPCTSGQQIIVKVPAPQVTIQQCQGVVTSHPHQPLFGRRAVVYAPAAMAYAPAAYAYAPMATYAAPMATYAAPMATYAAPMAYAQSFVQPAYAAYAPPPVQPTLTLSLAPQALMAPHALALAPCPAQASNDAVLKRLVDSMESASKLLTKHAKALDSHDAALDSHEQRLVNVENELKKLRAPVPK